MKDGEALITLDRLACYIRKANDVEDKIESKRAEIHRLEDQLYSLKLNLSVEEDALVFYRNVVNKLKDAAIDEGYNDKYLCQFMKDRKYKQRQAN